MIINKLLYKNEVKKFIRNGGEAGNNCKFYNANIDTLNAYLIKIGNNVTLSNCTLLAHDASTELFAKCYKIGKIVIGNNVFVGCGAIILPNVTIGDNVIIGAGSVVTKNIPSNRVVAGNPAKVISSYEEYKEKYLKLINDGPIFSHSRNKLSKQEQEYIKKHLNGIKFSDWLLTKIIYIFW